jgi:eukaryotic-like serine/threonine-protein kinase
VSEPRAADPREIFRLAEAIADGAVIDWDAEESTHPDLGETLRSLRDLEGVGQVHREDPDPTPTSWGPLEIRGLLRKGGFGRVYRAYDPALECEVALKLFPVGSRRRDHLAEARKLARIGPHPNILRVYGADEHGGRVGIWTELLTGQTLEERLEDEGPLGAEEAAQVGISVCRALAALHRQGLVHRDVKTQNVMRVKGGKIVLTDFGSAMEITELTEETPGPLPEGTLITMAPEQLHSGRVGPAADIWGLGVLLYRLVTHRYPMDAETLPDLIELHERKELTPLFDVRPDLPAEFVRVVERALAFDPVERYASAGELYQELAGVIGIRAAENDPDFVPAAPWWRSYGPPLAAAASVGVVLAVIGGYALLSGHLPWKRAATGPVATPHASGGLLGGIPRAPSTLIATARLFRDSDGRGDRLLPGARIQPGDHLFLEIEGSSPMYVYVLDRDEQDSAYVLYPGPAFDSRGPLAPGVTHRLPGTHKGEVVDWRVTNAGGTETIVVIASIEPQKEIERDIAEMAHVSPDRPVSLSERSREVLRGIGGIAAGPAAHSRAGADKVNGMIQKLYSDSTRGSNLWTWQIDLQNP